ncbi:MARTX multifunctional-autoprocessing repeats-in-toxin holotoxin RtxA [Vibrio vulnificus]|nr:MARTX multifunctional-autoprocessing repeats-in-toxin holotoxin RtxA [Vibrio vulnificus]EIV8616208.1 MARTX multifunctional-autoprocessing repeats-in-toxin holotoxin RtxA [Vibrio vulnificus]EIZ4623884.1 MARTX multifunctional-autoprocessing repeats-in-toxin holotoxin RtxA [Vibrio vulnificus]EJB0299221.1 MARTX multifunctional-autoprocessing repeats-in-toxin holotoxin RtxA [Vibrio vulnificus]
MGKPFWRSVEYFFTGNYSADDGNNSIVAIGFGGEIHAYGGDDHVTVGSIGATVYTGSGNDTVVGGSAYLRVEDTTGHLSVKGAAGYADINKSGDGNVSFAGAAGGVSIDHLGNHGDVNYGGAAAYNGITRKGLSGNVTFKGAGGYNALWHETNQGNLSFAGAGAGNKLDRTWFNRYQDSRGDVTFDGAGAANSISSRVETGNITFRGAGADNHLVRKGKVGDVTLQGAGASNRIERTRQAEDVYAQTRGNIRFEGVGGYNSLYSDVAHGDIHFSGGGAYNTIIRKGSGNDFAKEGMTNAKADEIVLTKAVMSGSWIGQDHHVTAVKSASEPNTYLFAFADSTYTKINKVQLRNDPQTGELKYYSTAWYKEGNHLSNLANQDISDNGGFTAVNINGAYTLSDLKVEHQQSLTVHAVEKDLTEYEWVTYANGALIDAKDVALSEAKMGGTAISTDGTTVDVQAVKSNRKPNTYVYAKVLGPYTKIVVVELANDPKTGALKYQARSWYKEGNHTADLANEDISSANGYHSMGKGGYSLSDLHYSVNAVRSTSETVADIDEYTDQTLFKPATDSGESSGDVHFNGAGGGNVIKSNVTRGNVYFNGGGIANVILHSSQFGNTEFNGGGAANVIVKSGEEGDLTFRGAGLANVLVHQSKQGKMDVYAGGAVNVLVRIGDGQYLAHLLAYGNISVHKGNGNSRVVMLGGYNTHTQIGSGNGLWLAAGGFNVMTQVGKGDVASVLAGGANVLTKVGDGDLTAGMLGGANVITHISGDNETSNTTAVALGGANILTKKGKGNALAVMGGGANVLTHVGDGTTTGVMVGGANILTKVGNGDTTGIILGVGNVLTHVGDGQTLGVMGAAGNIFTKVGDGTSIAVMIGAGNIFTHVGEGNAWALMGGLGNVFTKVGNGDALALMVAEANVFTHIGDGMSVALMLAKGNVATKVGNGTTLAAMVGNANIFTHVGSGSTFAAMIGQANIMTKVGDDLTAALMVGKANIYTHVGDGTSLGIFAGEVNVMTKVGNGTTLAAMFGKANIMTHVGDGLTGVLALGEANIVTKVGDDFMGVVAAAKANVVTHVGDATTAAVLAGKGNILTKVGEGTTVGLLISDIGNVMTHVGDGTTIGIAKGKANIITKVGDGLGVNVAWGQANVFTQVGDGDRYNFAKGEANVITKVGDGQEVSVVQGKANIITHVGNGDDYTGAWGKANVITKVGNGRNVVLAKGEANIVTQVGDGDSFNALWSKGNIVTKVGDGMQVTAAKGKANITTTVGDGLSVTAAYGDANINTKVGDGVSVNVAWGKYNINTKVGDGLNVAVMKGKANANIHIGDGLGINASYAQNNVAIKIGNGDFYSLAVASSNTSSNKLSALFDNIKQTVLGVGGSQAINYLVQGDEASSSGTQKGRGAIATPEITKLDGFQMDAIEEVGSDLGDSLTGSVTKVDTPDLNKMQNALNVDGSSDQTEAPNLIVNGDFEQGDQGWKSTHGVEASYSGNVYGVNGEGHGARVTELDTYTNTSLYQDLTDLTEGEVIAVSFDFAKRAGLSNNEGIEVLWNGEVVFSSSGDASAWKQKTLKLTAHAGSNRIEFKGTGQNDGLGYILDNVVAKSESSQQANAVSEHATQNQASQNALSDKERAEADRQRLEQEKQKQLDAVAGSQSQLESTDQKALENNGQAQRDAVKEESEAVTAELTKLAQGLDVLDGQATHTGESGDQWRNDFAGGLLDGVQRQLDDAKQIANDKIAAAKQTQSDNNSKVKESVAKSEAGVAKGEQNRAGAEQDIADAKADAETRKADAVAKSNDAKQAESDAHSAANDAQSRGDRDAMNAENKANQAQNDAKGTKQNEGDRPDREGVTGSGLSGNAHRVEGAGETGSHVTNDSQTNADGRFSEGLSEQEQEALEGATNAVNRLQINAGIRGKNSGSTISSMFTETNSDSIVVPTAASQDVVRKEIRISGVNLEGLGEASHDGTLVNTMLRESLPFYSLRTERNLLVQEGEEGFEVRSWPGTDGKSKTILLDNPEDAAQQKSIERFILANFDNFEQMPDELFLVDNKVLSHHDGRTRILAQKEDGAWTYNANVELMSVTELLDAAHVSGKVRGESYQQVIDALTEYHASTAEHADYELASVEKLLNLRKQVEGYVLGHPDSGRVQAMNALLNQVNSRLEAVSVLVVSEQSIKAHDSFSHLYDQLDNANLKESKHLYLDGNGDFVTKGKGNLANIDKLGGSDAVLEKVKAAVSHEYGQVVADTIFAGLSANDLAKDGKGIDIAGLNKVHQAIEQHMSPVSATMYIWKPSDHSALGHAALQIGQGRTQLEGQAAADFNKQNYVSWWPLGSKSSNIRNIFNVATEDQPDLKLRWSDFSQPAHQNDTLEHDMASEENDGFGLNDGETKLKRFVEKLNAAKGIDASYKDASEGYASVLLGNPDMLASTGIPAHVFQPFVDQWNDTSYDMMDVANRFAEELQKQAQASGDPALVEKRIDNVVRLFAERALEEIEAFKASQADEGRVFRINLEGLDVAAMQAEWNRLSNDPDARYQLLTKNCSSTVAKVLKAGGADKLIGHTWRPKFGVWTPTELFNFGQALQEAQLEIAAKKQSHQVTDLLDALSGNEKHKENVAIENDGTPPRDKESLSPLTRFLNNELYGEKDARRKIGDITQTLLDHAVENGESQKVTLKGEAGRLTGYYHQGAASSEGETSATSGKVVLFLHGSGSSAEEQASAIRNHYQKQGIDMLAVNLRGYGESDGGPSEKGLYQDARTMFNYLVNDKGIDPSNIIIHGYSMGGPIAADLARYAAQNGQAVSGLLLDRPMPSMTKAITAHEVANPAGIVGAIAKAVNGQFSVEKNLKGLPKETPILLLTDNEGLGEEGEKLRAKLAIAGYNVTGEQTFYGHEASNRLMGQYTDQIVSGLFNAEQAAVEAGEVLKGLEKDFKRYGDALKPDTSVPGKSKDIRTTKDFLNGYKNDHAKEIVDGFRSEMSIKQLVDLFVKGNWSAEQKGALAWEIESRALKVTFQNKSEKYNRLFREIASAGVVDAKATEQLAPQLMLLNLANDGFGGRCDPLSKLVLVAKQLENDGQVGVARQLLEKMYSAAAVLSNPTLYSDSEKANASKLLSSLAAIHAKNPMHDTSMKVWQEKLEGKQALTVNGVVEKITDASANGKPVLLELDAPGHAMAAWAKGSGDDRVYGFYDPNAGIVEFSSAEKFSAYLTRFFGKSDLNMAQGYKLGKNAAGEPIFNRVVVMDGNTLASYKPTFGDKTTMQGILDLPVFDATPIKKPTGGVASDLEALGDKTKVVVDLAQIFTVQELKERAKVFAKPIGASYQGILDQLDLVHQAKGRDQIAASFELNKKINAYIAEHPTSGRNQALTQLKEQVTSALFIGKMQIAQAGIDAIAQTRPELAARIFMVAIEEANGKHVGLTDMMVRWANEDPYLAPKHGYKGETPSDLGFDAKYHVDLSEHYADFKQWLETSQSNGLLSKATLDESTKTVHLGYSYQELQDLTGVESVQMAFYFLKEAAKKADPISGDSAEMILLKKFADQSYLSQLDSDRMDQIEGIYRSSHETDVDAWDRRYSGKGYDELTNKLASATGVDEQLSVLLDDRKGLLIGEVHGSDVNGLRFVNEQMDALKKQGVTVIGLEHLRSDLAQPLIDRYLATGVMSSELSAMLKTKHLDVALFENARANGMRIVALDANSSARPNVQGTEHGLMYRAGAANNIAVEVLQNLPDGEKFVAIYGKAHLQSHKGIEGVVPGITHRLDLPALKVSDSNQFTVEQDDVSLRVVYDDVANKPKITFKDSLSGANTDLHNQNVNDWERVVVTPTADGGETRFDGQIIVQMENDAVAAKAAANLAGKHPESSVVVQLDSDGNYRVVYGDPSKLDGKLRWQLVGHGRDDSESNNTRLSGYSADELAVKLAKFQQSFNQAENVSSKPDHISIVGCSLVSDDKQKGFGHQFINAMDANGLRLDVSVRSSELAVDETGRKHTKDANGNWVQKAESNKVSLSWNEQGDVVAKDERIHNGIAEGDIDLSRIGISDVDEPARGAIGDNKDVFDAPEKRKAETETSSSSANNKLSYSGNIQVNVGDGEFTAVNWGTSNVGIKVGTGGFKSLAFGDNNVMIHIGNGESKHSFDIGGYQALEGAQMFIGNRNVSFNKGRSNDLIVMMDKSIPTPPLVNPFDGAARISGVLQSIATSGEGKDWLAAQEQQWTLSGAKKFVKDMSGLDQSSSVDYTSLVELDSQNERSSRGLKHDAEAALNKQYNQWLSGNGNNDTSKLSRADKLRQANEKLAFNFAVGGQGADIQVTTGNWNFMFGDNIQSILDTNLGSLFGLMTQQFSATGQAKTTFTYTPEDLPRQLKNKLLGQLAGVGAETTLADIFGVDYTASGHIVSRNGEAVDGVAILKEMLEVIGEFSGDQLQAFVDPTKLVNSLEAGINMGADGIKSFAETHGLKEKAPEEEESKPSVSLNGETLNSTQGATVDDGSTETTETPDRAFGFNSLNLPNLFATIFSQDKQKEMKSLVANLKENLTADLLNMKEKTFDFLRNSGHLQGDGDINLSLGNYNFNWGGDGKDLGAYLGDNNNFWGGRGDDVFYATGTSNIFTGGEGNDMGVLMGRENMMFGGDGNDTAVVAGRINHVFLGAGDDQSFVFGEGGEIDTGSGRDYVVTSGNFNRVDTGDDQDYSVTIGNNNQVELGAGDDFANVFGNYNRINASAGNDVVKLMGYHAVLNGGEGEDHLIAAAISKFSQFNGGEGRDLMVLGGYQNTFKGGTDVDSFVVSGDVIDNLVEDIRSEDNIVFNGIDWQKLWFERSGYDLKLSILRDPASDSDQAKFEHIGSVTFSDYFNGNRAQVIIAMGEKDATGEREYTTLSESAIDALVQAMSGFDPQAGDNGFIDNLDSKSRVAITTAWADVVHKKGITV